MVFHRTVGKLRGESTGPLYDECTAAFRAMERDIVLYDDYGEKQVGMNGWQATDEPDVLAKKNDKNMFTYAWKEFVHDTKTKMVQLRDAYTLAVTVLTEGEDGGKLSPSRRNRRIIQDAKRTALMIVYDDDLQKRGLGVTHQDMVDEGVCDAFEDY